MPLVALLCAAALCAVQDPVRVSAALTQSRITVGATTTLQITVETRGAAPDDIRTPPLARELQVLGTSDMSQMQISVPGGRSRITRRDVVLVARAEGVYRIPPITVIVEGATYRTAPLDLIVRAASPRAGATAPTSSASSLRVSLQPDTVFVGQQVLLHAEVTFSEDMRARQSRPATFDPPAPTGFWIQDVPDPITVALRVREGRTVETQTYRRAYFPLTAGEFHFPPARLHYEVRRGFLYAPESRELVSDSARLLVLPLPAEGRPHSFTGAVGRLALSMRVQPAVVRAGEAVVLSVELQGIGNVKALPEPQLPELPAADVFPPSQESTVDVAADRVGGTKRFRWVIVPHAPGELSIPPIEYTVFDPELRTYVTLRSDAYDITVAPAGMDPASDTTLHGLRTAPATEPLRWLTTPAFLTLQAVPLLLLMGALHVRRRRSLPPGPGREAARIQRALEQIDAQSPAFLSDLEHLLCEAAVHVAGAPASDPVAWLRAHGSRDTADRIDALLSELRHLRYAPGVPFDARDVRRRTREAVALMTPRTGWRARAGGSAILILGAASMAAAQSGAFERGVELYHAQQYAAAAQSFHQYARAHAGDAHAWYNVGLASYRAGDTGRAAWAWLRAARLAPRDDGIRHNLERAGAAAALRRMLPSDRLTRAERALLATIAWWLSALALAAALLWRRRAYAWAAAPGALVLLALALATAADGMRPRLVTALGAGTTLYAAPTTREEALGELLPGEAAAVVQYGERWLRVRALRGGEGWVERSAVAAP